jgi:hypothetical protein
MFLIALSNKTLEPIPIGTAPQSVTSSAPVSHRFGMVQLFR